MHQGDYDDLYDEIEAVFDYSPPPVQQISDRDIILLPPSTFYDKHLDHRLSLKRVQLMPSLLNDLASCINEALKGLAHRDEFLPLIQPSDHFQTKDIRKISGANPRVSHARSVADFYHINTAGYCTPIASTLAYHIQAPSWYSVYKWYRGPGITPPDEYNATEDVYGPQIWFTHDNRREIADELWESLDDKSQNTLLEVRKRLPVMATWIIFAALEESEELLKNLETVTLEDAFHPKVCMTKGGTTQPVVITKLSPDANITPWTIPSASNPVEDTTSDKTKKKSRRIASTDQPPRRSARLRSMEDPAKKEHKSKEPAVKKKPAASRPNVVIPSFTPRDCSLSASTFIQHAWTLAVEKDSTHIIFHCGNFERIGVRHRGSQTLYLSELIDVPNCKDPAYGKLHVGLHMSILQDAIDRVTQQCESAAEADSTNGQTSKKQKRTQSQPDGAHRKRRKTRSEVSKLKEACIKNSQFCEVMLKETNRLDMGLIWLNYGVYNSQAPASFVRSTSTSGSATPLHSIRKSTADIDVHTFRPADYFTLTLASAISEGGTGMVHNATLEVTASDGKILTHDVVVKIAQSPGQRSRIRHEFSVYQHLVASNFEEIVPIFGLFEDVEDDATALIMGHGGISLCGREQHDGDEQVTVSPSERVAFIRAVENLHRVGVRHRDIRPHNLLINDAEEVKIIDFDMADMEASVGARKREHKELVALLDRQYRPPNMFASPATTNESNSSVRSSATVTPLVFDTE